MDNLSINVGRLPPHWSGNELLSKTDIEPILREVVEVFVRNYQPDLIILYGSYAWGTATPHSDIDLLIAKE